MNCNNSTFLATGLGFRNYRKIALFSLFLILITTCSFSQEKGFRGGIIAGAVASQVDGDMLSGYNKSGLQGGIFLVNKFTKRAGIQIEMKYIQKGSRTVNHVDSLNLGNKRYYKLRLNYIEVPFLYNHYLYYLKKQFILEAGVGFAYLFRVREDIGGFGMMEISPNDRQFSRFEFPILCGVSFFPTENFHINFRYSYSVLPIRPHPANQTWYFDRGQYNNLISFGMYLNF